MNHYDKVWTEKYRPKKIDDMVLDESLKKRFTNIQDIPNLLFYGKPGTGKTTMAKILANELAPDSYMYVEASKTNGIDFIRNEIDTFVQMRSISGNKKIVILDEADGLSSSTSGNGSSAQSALRGIMEEYLDNVRFILTANYGNKIIKPLLSRCEHHKFSFTSKDLLIHLYKIIQKEKIIFDKDKDLNGLKKIVSKCYPDIRQSIVFLQKSCYTGSFSLDLGETDDNSFAIELFEKIKNKEDCFEIRKFIINNTDKFSNDYHELMKSLFDIMVDEKVDHKNIIILAEHMYKHGFVMDVEINFFAMIIKILENF